ncbi:PP2C family protein-serine/threonine phosphatase [Aurantivibrio plasticivorans]
MAIIKSSAVTDKGLQRGNNEDSYLSLPEQGLWVIADGMGGHDAGEVASAIVVETIQKERLDERSLADAIQRSHQSVLEAVENGTGAKGMGSTVVALETSETEYQVSWVGDSRAYLWTPDKSGGTLEQLTTDHSYVQMLLATGAISEEDVATHPDKNIITQCIGSTDVDAVKVDSVHGKWQSGQWVLLCSDGLTDEVSDENIAQTLCESRTTDQAATALMKLALDHGGRDNITLQLVEAPRQQHSAIVFLQDWLPSLSGKPTVDHSIYGITLLCFILLCYWLWVV